MQRPGGLIFLIALSPLLLMPCEPPSPPPPPAGIESLYYPLPTGSSTGSGRQQKQLCNEKPLHHGAMYPYQ